MAQQNHFDLDGVRLHLSPPLSRIPRWVGRREVMGQLLGLDAWIFQATMDTRPVRVVRRGSQPSGQGPVESSPTPTRSRSQSLE